MLQAANADPMALQPAVTAMAQVAPAQKATGQANARGIAPELAHLGNAVGGAVGPGASPRDAGRRCGTTVMRRWATVSMQSQLGMNQPKRHPSMRSISEPTGELHTSDSDAPWVGPCRWCSPEAQEFGRPATHDSAIARPQVAVCNVEILTMVMAAILGLMRLGCPSFQASTGNLKGAAMAVCRAISVGRRRSWAYP